MRVVIPQIHSLEQLSSVHPHAGMWVEMDKERAAAKGASLFIPMRGCGLKYESVKIQSVVQTVHPHTGVWVEIIDIKGCVMSLSVYPHTWMWVEMLEIW